MEKSKSNRINLADCDDEILSRIIKHKIRSDKEFVIRCYINDKIPEYKISKSIKDRIDKVIKEAIIR